MSTHFLPSYTPPTVHTPTTFPPQRALPTVCVLPVKSVSSTRRGLVMIRPPVASMCRVQSGHTTYTEQVLEQMQLCSREHEVWGDTVGLP